MSPKSDLISFSSPLPTWVPWHWSPWCFLNIILPQGLWSCLSAQKFHRDPSHRAPAPRSLCTAQGGRLQGCSDALSRLILCDPVDCGPPDSSAHGVLHARMLGYCAARVRGTETQLSPVSAQAWDSIRLERRAFFPQEKGLSAHWAIDPRI